MFTPHFWESEAAPVNHHFILGLLDLRLPNLQELNLGGFALHFERLVLFIKRHQILGRARLSRSCFHVLGEYDDGNKGRGPHEERVEEFLRGSTSLLDIEVQSSKVCSWEAVASDDEDGSGDEADEEEEDESVYEGDESDTEEEEMEDGYPGLEDE